MRILCIFLLLIGLALAQGAPTLVWIDQTTRLTDDAINTALSQLAAQTPNPSHIVVLVHGFDVPREDSQAQFTTVAQRLQAAFAKAGQPNVAVLGVQWDSAVDAGLFSMEDAYNQKTLQSRATGRFGLRQLLIAVEKRFPGVPLDLMAHSMGCELAAAALRPDMKFDPTTDALGAFEPKTDFAINSFVMCGSDLDYDAAYKGDLAPKPQPVKLMWMTISPYLGEHEQDRVLKLRALIRGAAAGSVLPEFTELQWNGLTQGQRVLFDNVAIPTDHAYLSYYGEDRINRIVPNVIYKADPKGRQAPPELASIAAVMAQPSLVNLLTPFLDSQDLSTKIYALYRLECLLCGGPKHLANEYLSNEFKKMRDRPKLVRQDCKDSPCQVMKQGFWPTEAEFTRAGAPKWAENQ